MTSSPREQLSLDRDWRFHLGDIPFPVIRGHSDSYSNAKAARAWGAAAPDYDDTAWRKLSLPHDWAVEGPFDPQENLSQGFRPRGFAWYRRHFKLPVSDRGRHLELQFDGIATHCTVWVNGSVVHRNWCGYTSFSIDITPFAKYGGELNTIAIRVDANAMEGWWYEGAGMYRHTWLVKRNAVHLITDGVYAHPVRGTDGTWTLPVEATVAHSGHSPAPVRVETTLLDPEGNLVGQRSAEITVQPFRESIATFSIPVAAPRLWSVDTPALYEVRTVLIHEGAAVDGVTTFCGFRTLRFDPNEGFFLNEQPLKLKGVCNHQDHAGVGVALPDSLWEFRLRKLKEMGVNAYRCAHNPPSTEFLDLCDRMGILVMDENRHFNSSPEYMRQLEWLIRRDRNHPSVFLWSVFNEEPMQGTEVGYEMVRRMTATVKRLDATRPVTAAMNGGLFSPVNVSQAVDVVGFNYQIEAYDPFHQANPRLPVTSSEDTSAFMTRGEYVTDPKRNRLDSYDTQFAPWGASHRSAWGEVARRPFLAGGFVWTGFDYRGEPTPLQWPSAGSFFGCMDLCGFPKSAFYIHQAQWLENRPVLHLIPHWNWPGREDQPIRVMAISNADSICLTLNGVSLGTQSVDPVQMTSWEVPYAAGRLEAIAYQGNKEIARAGVETTGAPVALQLVPDRSTLAGDGWDAQPVTVQAVDAAGRPVPTANFSVEFEISGPGAIIGLGNGDPNSHEPEKGKRRSLFHGLAQVIVQSVAAGSGPILLRAHAPSLQTAETMIATLPTATPPFVPETPPVLTLQAWRMSPITTHAPNPNQEVAENDMNTWMSAQPGELQFFIGGTWSVYRIRFQPFAAVQVSGGQIVFQAVTGKAEAWLDGKMLGRKTTHESASLTVPLPPGSGARQLSVMIETQNGERAGFDGLVTVSGWPSGTS